MTRKERALAFAEKEMLGGDDAYWLAWLLVKFANEQANQDKSRAQQPHDRAPEATAGQSQGGLPEAPQGHQPTQGRTSTEGGHREFRTGDPGQRAAPSEDDEPAEDKRMIERLAEFGDRRPTWGYIIVALGFALALWMEVGLRP